MDSDVLYINGLKADITGVSISENRQVNDLFEVNGRQSSYTNTIDLPKTENNISIFNGLDVETNNSRSPYRYQKTTYLRNGVEMFSNANTVIKETSSSFKLNIYFDNSALFDVIDGLNLSDLNLSTLSHDLTIDEYVNRLNGTNLLYPLANYGAQQDEVIILDYQSPAIRVKYLWDKIFANAGFTYRYKGRGNRLDYSPFTTKEFTDAFISLDNGFNKKDNTLDPVLVYTGNRVTTPDFSQYRLDVVLPNITFTFWDLPFQFYEQITFNTNTVVFDKITPQTLAGVTSFTARESGYYKISLGGSLIVQDAQFISLEIISSQNVLSEIQVFEQGVNNVGFEDRFYLVEGQSFQFRFNIENEDNELPLDFNYNFNLNIELDNQEVRVNLDQYLTNITQSNFIKDICNYFGLTFINKGDVYEFITYQELFTPFARYSNFNALEPVNYVFLDWSDKFSTLDREVYQIGNYSKKNIFKYLYDDDTANFADGTIEVDNETINSEGVIVSRIFKAPENESINISGNQLVKMSLYEIDGDKVKTKKTAPYIFIPEQVNGSFDYKVDGGEVNTYNGSFYVAKFGSLSWQRSLTKWNSGLNAVLKEQRKITANIALNELDVNNLDFFKLIYIKQLGGLYYLNKVLNYQNNVTTKVELIKVQPIAQQGSFSNAFSNAFDN